MRRSAETASINDRQRVHLNGLIVRRGQALGVATPANRRLHAIVRLIESK
jgi:ketopantoate reductase